MDRLPSQPAGTSRESEFSLEALLSLRQVTSARQRYVSAWLGIFIFDLVATLPEERVCIWNNKWTPLKVLYLLNRYTALAHQIFSSSMIFGTVSPALCHRSWWFEVVGGMLVAYFCALIMSIRILAIYERNPYIAGLLGIMLAGVAAVFVYCATLLQAFQLPSMVAQVVDFHGCIPGSRKIQYQKFGGAVWSAPLAFDLGALVLTILRCLRISQVLNGSRTPLVNKILSTGVLYFVFITASNLVNVVLYSLPSASPSLQTFHTAASDAITSIMCSRLVLSLFTTSTSAYSSKRCTDRHSGRQRRGHTSDHTAGRTHSLSPQAIEIELKTRARGGSQTTRSPAAKVNAAL